MKFSFGFKQMENILYRENAIIAAEDVPILLNILCRESGQKTPARILREIHEAAVDRGDEDEEEDDES